MMLSPRRIPGEFHMGMVDMELCPLDKPAPPANPNAAVEFKLRKMACRNYEKQAEVRHRNSSRVYALIIGQCAQALWNHMEANKEWDHINDESNVMDPLQPVDPKLHDSVSDPTEASAHTHGCRGPSVCF
jgi:hypothetical protein